MGGNFVTSCKKGDNFDKTKEQRKITVVMKGKKGILEGRTYCLVCCEV